MKNFKKWFDNFDCDTIDCGGIDCYDVCKEIRAKTWRTALEEVLEWLNYSTEHKEIADKIHKKLEDEA